MRSLSKTLSWLKWLASGLIVVALGSCAATMEEPAPPSGPAPATPQVEASAPQPAPAAPPANANTPRPFDEALSQAVNSLFGQVHSPADASLLVIDPMIDGITAMQTAATRKMAGQIAELVRSQYPRFDLQPFTGNSLRRWPKVLLGTVTLVNSDGQPSGARSAYRICLALADLRSAKVTAKSMARAQMAGVDHTPTEYFQDSPAWMKEPASESYLNTCHNSQPGDAIQSAYSDGLGASALINDAIAAYDAGRYSEALERYASALELPAGHQLRVFNGVYLANLKLGRSAAAADAFGRIVDYGLAKNRLAVKFIFKPGAVAFVPDKQLNTQYPIWMKEIARRAAQSKNCLEVVGHTSRSGAEPQNQRLSQLRAEYIKQRLQSEAPPLAKRVTAQGVGSRENLVGTGKDDLSDALDRRVVFQVTACAGSQYY